MQANGFFDRVGETIGDVIRTVVEFLLAIFTNFFGALEEFVDGLSRSLGINASFFSLLVLIIGLYLLWGGVRALLRGSLFGAIVRILLALFILSWLIM
ncbi:MAG: hypothetical protein ACTH5L_07305 [Halomonas sp.]|uniref:Permeases of the major facilitator superfamily n=1 Tax=Halomonas citrativorans TaxID=2742612 RepID=A0A1R4I5Q3_9GAMM|nr:MULTISPECIES: hypothetical protein [Halomonas]SJN14653.1 Permeases of the major facilitator superfamily [Halomonas citrativorans]HCR97174.1 hypothetical protein [Halomonas sp.]